MNGATGSADVSGRLSNAIATEVQRNLEGSLQVILHCLDQLDDKQIWWRPRADMNSIGNLVLHLAGNLTQRFGAVIAGQPDDRDRFREFTERGSATGPELRSKLEAAIQEGRAIVEGLSPTEWVEPRQFELLTGRMEQSVVGVALQAITHLNGHAQEILHLTRIQMAERYQFRQPGGVPPEMRLGAASNPE